MLEYAYRVKDDIPFETDVVKFETMKSSEEPSENRSSLPVSFDTPKSKPICTAFKLDETFSDLGESSNDSHSETVCEGDVNSK